MDINCTREEMLNIIDDKETKVLITGSIETMKKVKKVNAAKMKYSN